MSSRKSSDETYQSTDDLSTNQNPSTDEIDYKLFKFTVNTSDVDQLLETDVW